MSLEFDKLSDFCEKTQKSVSFYRSDFIYLQRIGSKRKVLFVQRAMPAVYMSCEGSNILMSSHTSKFVPEKERSKKIKGAYSWDDNDTHKTSIQHSTFFKLTNVKIATLFQFGVEFITNSGLDLFIIESIWIENPSLDNMLRMCGEEFSRIPVREDAVKESIAIWTNKEENKFNKKLKKIHENDESSTLGQVNRNLIIDDDLDIL